MNPVSLLDYMKDRVLLMDGALGTMLQTAGLPAGTAPETWNLANPAAVTDVHRAYLEAGADVIVANTFGVSPLRYPGRVQELVDAAFSCAGEAVRLSGGGSPRFIALDIGPLGRLLAPYGDLDFEDAVQAFGETVVAGVRAGADLIYIETMTDGYETKAALLAAKTFSSLPVFVSNAYESGGRLLSGADPEAMVAMLEGLGADAVGVNCSFGPDALLPVARAYLKAASVPVLMKPNAGLPRDRDGKTVYDVDPGSFAAVVAEAVKEGVRIVGGCCGTTPAHLRALSDAVRSVVPVPVVPKKRAVVSSASRAVVFGDLPLLIGERINPTGKKRFRQALADHDLGYVQTEGLKQAEAGVHLLDVNVGTPEVDEKTCLAEAVAALQSVCDLPLQIDTADPAALEAALRRYNGKALVNSVNGRAESMAAVFPLVKKYGGLTVALTLDENGIPETAAGRLGIAKKILAEAEKYGLGKHDLIFDPLTLTVSADGGAPTVTLEALRLIRDELGCRTVLGVSNVSFGLPSREAVNSTFFAMALESGLSAAILNPFSTPMTDVYHAYLALTGLDRNCLGYIAYKEKAGGGQTAVPADARETAADSPDALRLAIVRGLSREAARLTGALLPGRDPLSLITDAVIPALDEVGRGFEEKKIFLPSLLMSAEAAGASFDVVKAASPSGGPRRDFTVILATVRGDIHDIGKNIVRLLLENYGFRVVDLGKDVPPGRIVEAALAERAPLVGLSALMTTTVPAMEETIRALRKSAPFVKIVVGGAVLTREYAESIGADAYAKDAMATVRYAEELAGDE